MKRFGKIAVCLAAGLACNAVWCASDTPPANNPAADNPYALVVSRNIFGLLPPPPPEDPKAKEEKELPKITPEGIYSVFGYWKAMFKVAAKPGGQPAKDQFYSLSEGQAQDDIEVVRIDNKNGIVTFKNHGFEQELPLVSAPSSGGGGPGPAPAGGPPPGMAGVMPGGGYSGGGNFSSVTTIGGNSRPAGRNPFAGNRDASASSGSGAGGAGGANMFFGNPAAHSNPGPAADLPQIPAETQTIMVETDRLLHQQEINQGSYPPLPPTDLTSQEDLEHGGIGGTPLVASPTPKP